MALVIDPVCGMEFDKRTAGSKSVYQNRTYYFCHAVCKKIFDATPEQFVSEQAEQPDNVSTLEGETHPETPTPDVEWKTIS
ncbi:MAG: YHS domain-containing protein [Chloroflexi bacterium]|nr:YHS domain-containing protein [Chloroflexota bacterium]